MDNKSMVVNSVTRSALHFVPHLYVRKIKANKKTFDSKVRSDHPYDLPARAVLLRCQMRDNLIERFPNYVV